FVDRFGKGIRSAPRDVLLADATDQAVRGRAFGFHRAMDTAGATLGPLLALLIVWLVIGMSLPEKMGPEHRTVYTLIFLAATVPGLLGWLVLMIFVPERGTPSSGCAGKEGSCEGQNAPRRKGAVPGPQARPSIRLSELGRPFKVFLAVVTLFSIGNSSDAFLVLRARSEPINMGFLTFLWVYVAFNALSAGVALRSGILSDRIGRKPVAVAGWLVFSVVYFAMARVTTPTEVWIWFVVYGIYYGMTEGILRAFAVDLVPSHLRGTAVGAYYTFAGTALLPASLIAGFLWQNVSHAAPFYYGAATSALAAMLLGLLVKPEAPTAR
ncbi:MAG: MFS transporter, partial [Armatimonadota bacterium]